MTEEKRVQLRNGSVYKFVELVWGTGWKNIVSGELANADLRYALDCISDADRLTTQWRGDSLPQPTKDGPSVQNAWDDGWVRSQYNCADELDWILKK